MSLLDKINKENDIHRLSQDEILTLPGEIRDFIIRHVSQTGGHLASNLGAVELTIALHMILRFPKDKLIWDVGHQSYTHKILTGRKDEFDRLRQIGGISGFPKRSESECDCFGTGHSSTSVSAGLGFAKARELRNESYTVVSVIGDGALTGGLAFEALNNASELKSNFIIVLNDNEMSISRNVGGLSRHLASIRTAEAYQEFKSDVRSFLGRLPYEERVIRRIRKAKSSIKQLLIPGMIFENMGITYLGPVNGHSVREMTKILREAKKIKGAVVVHVQTEKGRGYEPARRHPAHFHGVAPFDPKTGKAKKAKTAPSYTDVFSAALCRMAKKDKRVAAITAAMADGTGLKRFRERFPERFFDVGIAEGHAVTFAAGLSAAGMRPVFAVYSSFLQRAYDQILHDVCMQNLPVVLAIDRAGLVGEDGDTHQGIFDISFLSSMPNMTVIAPKNRWELCDMLRFALHHDGPVALRYYRGTASEALKEKRSPIEWGKSEEIARGSKVALLAVGNMVETAMEVREILSGRGIDCTVINTRFIKPCDRGMFSSLPGSHRLIVTIEEGILKGGFGETVTAYFEGGRGDARRSREQHACAEGRDVRVLTLGIDDRFVGHGSVSALRAELGLDAAGIARRVLEAYHA